MVFPLFLSKTLVEFVELLNQKDFAVFIKKPPPDACIMGKSCIFALKYCQPEADSLSAGRRYGLIG